MFGTDRDTVDSLTTSLLEQFANADWEEYARRVSAEFDVEIAVPITKR